MFIRHTRRLVLSAALIALAGAAHAQQINMTGDLGTASLTGLASPVSLTNTTSTTNFSWAGPGGSITGDVIVSNDPTGTIFTMTITNLALSVTGPNSAGVPALDVTLTVDHLYQSATGFGTYTGSHALSGFWTNLPTSYVQLDSTQDVGYANTPLTTLLATSSPFALSSSSPVVVTSGSGKYGIQAVLHIFADGLGTVTLPTSAHISATLVPAPGALALLALSPLAARRRRPAAA
jgi:hypothetical protein